MIVMETSSNVQKGWRTREQKEEIILQWQQSKKSRKEFCEESGIGYNSLVSWCKQMKDQKTSPGFTEVKVKSESGLFAPLCRICNQSCSEPLLSLLIL